MLLYKFNAPEQLAHVLAELEHVLHGLSHPVHAPCTAFLNNPVGQFCVQVLVAATK